MSRRLAPPPKAEWIELVAANGEEPAVRVLFAPIGDKARAKAGRAMIAVREKAPEEIREELVDAIGPEGRLLKALSPEAAELLGEMADTVSRETIRAGILDWTGLGGPGEADEVLPVTAETISWFMADKELVRIADLKYVQPDAQRLAEKNASSGSPTGTSVVATPADNIATSPASPAPGSDASPTPKRAKAASARISSTSPKPKRAKRSGG